jgi:hypothetical protein
MAEYPPDNNINIPVPVYRPETAENNSGDGKAETGLEHLEDVEIAGDENNAKHETAGISVIRQQHTIPTTGKRMPTSKWEYIFFCVFYFSLNGARRYNLYFSYKLLVTNTITAIGGNGGALRQALLSQQFPNGMVKWGGQTLPSTLQKYFFW